MYRGVTPSGAKRSKKVWLVLDRDDVVTLVRALEMVFEQYSPAEVADGLVENEDRLWELLREKLRTHDLGRRARV